HPGSMVQVGLNMGPWHAWVFGYAASFTRKLTPETMQGKDNDLIGAMSLCWNMFRKFVPLDVTDEVVAFLNSCGYPQMGTCTIPPGTGFELHIRDKVYHFSKAGRCPPEGTAAQGYQA
ncbi:hypothetical protein FA15DRAFT_603404, partial [Coprinopsis marcescibilis]